MGLLEKIIEPVESIANVSAANPTTPASPIGTGLAGTNPPPETCILCDSAILYATIYDRQNFRCPICEPPPAERLIAIWLVDGKPLAEAAAAARSEAGEADNDGSNLADLGQADPHWRAPNPWLEKTFERYEELQINGWYTLVLKREFKR